MRVVGNLVHLLTGGLALSLGWLMAAVLFSPLPATRPLAVASLKMAVFWFWPGGKDIVRDRQLDAYRQFVRTGTLPGDHVQEAVPVRGNLAVFILWLPAGMVLMCAHAIHGVIAALPTLSCPWQSRSLSLLAVAGFPLGARIVGRNEARAIRYAGQARRPHELDLEVEEALALGCRKAARPMATVTGAAFILWASTSANEALLYSPPVPVELRQHAPVHAMWNRAQANPPAWLGQSLPRPVPTETAKDECVGDAGAILFTGLSRRHVGYPMRIGSRPVELSPGDKYSALRHVVAVQRFANSVANAKVRDSRCGRPITARVAKSSSFAATTARFVQMAQKAAPDLVPVGFGQGAQRVVLRTGHSVPLRNLVAAQKWMGLRSPAKSAARLDRDEVADRAAKAASLLVRSDLTGP